MAVQRSEPPVAAPVVPAPVAPAAPARVSASVATAPENDIVSIDESAWTVQDPLAVVIDVPQEWPTQDYVNDPPPRVDFDHPVDSI